MFYLLPSSKKQSKVMLKNTNLNGQLVSFHDLQSVRESLFRCVSVNEAIPPLPVWRRFKGDFWESLEFWVLPPSVQKIVQGRSIVLSPLYGFLSISDLIPLYRLDWDDMCGERKVKDVWRPILKSKSGDIFMDQMVYNFLGKESDLIDFSTARGVIEFEFYRKGRKVKSSSKHKAYVLRYLVEKEVDFSQLHKINFYDYRVKGITEKANRIKVSMESEGLYI